MIQIIRHKRLRGPRGPYEPGGSVFDTDPESDGR
jgi:hypothetical protein